MTVPWRQVGTLVRRGQSTLPVQCYWVLQRTRVCRMRCSVVSIAWSQRAVKLYSSRCAARKMPFNTCPSNPISSRSSMVSSNWYCNLVAAILTRWKKSNCCSRIRTWSAVALRAALGEGPKCATLSLMRYPGTNRLMDKEHSSGEALAKIHGRMKICAWSTNCCIRLAKEQKRGKQIVHISALTQFCSVSFDN